jgi:hypothetical protein
VQGSAAYVGFERITGQLLGREGTFLLHHTASAARGDQPGAWTVVPDSGTGELCGLRGNAEISVASDGGHTFVLEYDIESPSTT